MKEIRKTRLLAAGATVSAVALTALPAMATEGYFALGFGPVQRGQGGAGVAAAGTDAMAATINPASVATLGRGYALGVELFSPSRGYEGDGTFFVAPGSVRSGSDYFLIPNFAYNMPLANGGTLNFAAYGNGGMNTSYGDVANPNCGGGSGVYCGGAAGVDLTQLFLSVGYARKDGNVSWGVAPVVAIQAFEATGLAAFSGISSDPTALTNNGMDWSYGIGLKAGLTVDVAPGLSFGLAGQTKMAMSKFEKYAGLFADGGSFDIPAQISAGLAWTASPGMQVMLDYQKIYYSGVESVSNGFTSLPLGAKGGTGFGWDDVEVIKLGMAWDQNEKMTWRAGYAYVTNPVSPEDVTLGILAPGVVESHYTLGGSYRPNERDSIDFSLVYAPNVAVTGPEVTPLGPTPGLITIDMDQIAVSIGFSRKF